MTIGEKLQIYRNKKGLTQEFLAEYIVPSSKNFLKLAEIFEVSIDELTHLKVNNKKDKNLTLNRITPKYNKILRNNLILIAITLQAMSLNIFISKWGNIQIISKQPYLVLVFKFMFLLMSSMWMTYNLKYEKDFLQYRKNTKIELIYVIVQFISAYFSYIYKQYFVAVILIIIILIIYVYYINPKYMNRKLFKNK